MKMKIKKARLQEIIQEEYARHEKKKLREGPNYDYPAPGMGPPATPDERMKDEVQTAMMNAAMELMRTHGHSEKELKRFEYDLEDRLVGAMEGMTVVATTSHPSVNEGDIDEETLSRAIAEVLAEEGLGDGDQLGGNYSTGYGGSSGESPDQTVVPGGKK